MRLEEPLQGIILCQGHTVMHLSMFVASFMVTKDHYKYDTPELHARSLGIEIMFYWGSYLHLLTAILQLGQTFAKQSGYKATSTFFQLLIPFAYFIPTLYIQYLTAQMHVRGSKNDQIMKWFTLETFVFNSQVFGGILFMLCGYYFKFFSVWNTSKPDITHEDADGKITFIPNIFYKRKTADYLHYMKFEAFNWILHSGFLTLDVLMLVIHYQMKGNSHGSTHEDSFIIGLYVLCAIHCLVLFAYSYQLTTEHKREQRFNVFAKKVTWWDYAILGFAVCGYIYVSYIAYSYPRSENVLIYWILIEAISFPFLIMYNAISVIYLKSNCAAKLEQENLTKGGVSELEMEAMGMESMDHKIGETTEGLLNKDDEDGSDKDVFGTLNDSVASLQLESKLVAMHDKQAMTVAFPQDQIGYAVLCHYRPNETKFFMTDQKLLTIIKNVCYMLFIQVLFTYFLTKQFLQTWKSLSPDLQGASFTIDLFVCMFMGTSLMHMNLYGFFVNAMTVMKFVNNHSTEFKYANLMFCFGLIQMLLCFMLELTNVMVLFSQQTCQFVLESYVSMTVLITVNNVYYNHVIAANDYSDLKNVLNAANQPQVKWRNKDNSADERPGVQKVFRIIYVFLRSIYACFIFYFAPMIYLVLNEFHIVQLIVKKIEQ